MLDNINKDTKRNWIIAIYVLIGILFTGLIPFLQPSGIVSIIAGILIILTLFEVWDYQPNGNKTFFWIIFVALIGVTIYCFFKPIMLSGWIISGIMGVIAVLLMMKELI